MFKLWQFLWKRSSDRQDQATTSDLMALDGVKTPVTKFFPHVRDAAVQHSPQDNLIQESRLSLNPSLPSVFSPLAVSQPSVRVAEQPQQSSDWIKPVGSSLCVLSTNAWNMLKPVEWQALGGVREHRSVRIPLGRLGVDKLFGKQRHVFRRIQQQATGVRLKLRDAVLHLTGPAERIDRLLDFLDHLNAQVGESFVDSILIRCKGPELATKWERLDALYKSHSHIPPFDRCSVVPVDDLHFTLAKMEGQSSPAMIREVVGALHGIINNIRGQGLRQEAVISPPWDLWCWWYLNASLTILTTMACLFLIELCL